MFENIQTSNSDKHNGIPNTLENKILISVVKVTISNVDMCLRHALIFGTQLFSVRVNEPH